MIIGQVYYFPILAIQTLKGQSFSSLWMKLRAGLTDFLVTHKFLKF